AVVPTRPRLVAGTIPQARSCAVCNATASSITTRGPTLSQRRWRGNTSPASPSRTASSSGTDTCTSVNGTCRRHAASPCCSRPITTNGLRIPRDPQATLCYLCPDVRALPMCWRPTLVRPALLSENLELRAEAELQHARLIRQRRARERLAELRVRLVQRERLEVGAVE